ncbi:hypothetical protein ATKI12_3958 [Kitasatospora sp. Ki12]
MPPVRWAGPSRTDHRRPVLSRKSAEEARRGSSYRPGNPERRPPR